MSDALAIAAVTTTLRNLLQTAFDNAGANVRVTTMPPDKIEVIPNGNRVNVFLYQVMINPHWRNQAVPWRARSGENGREPLPLNLYYLITAYYGESEAGVDTITNGDRLLGSHRLLGQAASVLHDHIILDQDAIQASLPDADKVDHPYTQLEKVRITPQSLSLDELSKLWAGFQTQQRLSMAYEVSVVLIESALPGSAALPVLTRGKEDHGIDALANLLPPFPTLTEVRFPNAQPAVRLGETLTLVGHHLDADDVIVRCVNNRAEVNETISVEDGMTGEKIPVRIPHAPADWPVGLYTLTATLRRDGEQDRLTNTTAYVLAPQIEPPDVPVHQDNGDVSFSIACRPQIRDLQTAVLYFGDREVMPAGITTPESPEGQPQPDASTTLVFELDDVEPGDYWVRLRVDGIDSLLIDFTTNPPTFDGTQKVVVV